MGKELTCLLSLETLYSYPTLKLGICTLVWVIPFNIYMGNMRNFISIILLDKKYYLK